jgi:hypothetical protein
MTWVNFQGSFKKLIYSYSAPFHFSAIWENGEIAKNESIVIFEFTANDVNCQSIFDIVQKKMIVVGVYCSWQNAIACSFTRKELLESSLDALDDREPRYRSKSLIIDTHSPISHGENHQRNMDHTWRILTPNKNTRICWRCWHSSSSTVARR